MSDFPKADGGYLFDAEGRIVGIAPTALSQPCPCCSYEVNWYSSEEDWASCPNCDLPVKHFGVYLDRARPSANDAPTKPLSAPASWKASTLRLIADHFDAPEGKKIVIAPSSKMRQEWAELLNQIADEEDEK